MNFEIVQEFEDFACLQAIEDDAGEVYRLLGYDPDPWAARPVDTFLKARSEGLLWVARGAEIPNEAWGFAVAQYYPPHMHLDEVDVLRAVQGNGIGRGLVERVIDEGRRRGCKAVTLRTFRAAAWSVGLYEKLGFTLTSEVFPHLGVCMAREQAEGLPSGDMCTMAMRL